MPNGQSSSTDGGSEYPLPDGRTLVLPDTLTVGDRAFLRSTLGPEGYAQMQAHLATRRPIDQLQERETAYSPFTPTGISGPPGDPEVERTRRANEIGSTVAGGMAMIPGAVESIAAQGLKGALKSGAETALRTGAGSVAGAYGGGKAGRYLGGETGESVGKLAGGLAGGYMGATGRGVPSRYSLMERILSRQPAATEAAAETAGSAAATPGITRVPEPRPLFPGENPANMGSVPREQLPALAQQGKPGAVEQLQQLGQRPIITPRGSDIPSNPPLQGTLEERIRGGATPTPATEEDFLERMRRRAPGVNPATRSIRRKMGGDTARMAEQDEALRRSKRQ